MNILWWIRSILNLEKRMIICINYFLWYFFQEKQNNSKKNTYFKILYIRIFFLIFIKDFLKMRNFLIIYIHKSSLNCVLVKVLQKSISEKKKNEERLDIKKQTV